MLHVGEGSEREQCHSLSPHPTLKRLEVSPAATTPTGFYSQRLWGFILPTLETWLCLSPQNRGLSLLVYPHTNAGLPTLPAATSLHILFTPSTGLDECFLFNSLVVWHPYSSIFLQFWLFLVFKLVVSFFWLCEETKHIYLLLYLGWISLYFLYFSPSRVIRELSSSNTDCILKSFVSVLEG